MTKARSKAQKINSKRGRPRLPAVAHEHTGRKSRRKASNTMRQAMTEQEARSVVVQKRIRDGEIVAFRDKSGRIVSAEEQAVDPRRGYALGLMFLDGTITQQQHDAGVRYADDMARYYGLTGLGFPSPRAQNLFAVRGVSGEESGTRVEAAKKAKAKAGKLRELLQKVGNIDQGRRVEHAVKEVALLDNIQARKWPAHMHDYIRRGLNALALDYGLVSSL